MTCRCWCLLISRTLDANAELGMDALESGGEESVATGSGVRQTVDMSIFDPGSSHAVDANDLGDGHDSHSLPDPHPAGALLYHAPLDVSGISLSAITKLRSALTTWIHGGISESVPFGSLAPSC